MHITTKFQKIEFDKKATTGVSAFSIKFIYLILDWRSVTNGDVKYQMGGNMFLKNQMLILTFLSYYHSNVFKQLWECQLKK